MRPPSLCGCPHTAAETAEKCAKNDRAAIGGFPRSDSEFLARSQGLVLLKRWRRALIRNDPENMSTFVRLGAGTGD